MVFFKETRCFAGVDVRTRCLQKRSTNLESLGSLGTYKKKTSKNSQGSFLKQNLIRFVSDG